MAMAVSTEIRCFMFGAVTLLVETDREWLQVISNLRPGVGVRSFAPR